MSAPNPFEVNEAWIAIRMNEEFLFVKSEDTGIPYQNLINLYLRDCVQSGRKISIKWASQPKLRSITHR